MIKLWLSYGIDDEAHLCWRERSGMGVVADGTQAVGKAWIEVYPLLQLLPGRLRRDVGTVELCQLHPSVLAHLEGSVIHIGCKDNKKNRNAADNYRTQLHKTGMSVGIVRTFAAAMTVQAECRMLALC